MSTLPVILFLGLALAGCEKSGCFGSAGPVEQVSRATAPFHRIDLYDDIDLVLTQGAETRVEIAAGSALIPNIRTEVAKGVLTIRNESGCRLLRDPAQKITAFVQVARLDTVNCNGSGNVTSTNILTGERIGFYSTTGAGNVSVDLDVQLAFSYIFMENADFTFRGRAHTLFSYTNARGTIDFSDLQVNKAVIEYGSVRDAQLNVSEELDVILYHTGNLYYSGNPVITNYKQHGTGRLIRK